MSSFINSNDDEIYQEEDLPVLIVPQGGEDWEGASEAKITANEAKDNGNYETSIEYYTKSMELGGASALTLANRYIYINILRLYTFLFFNLILLCIIIFYFIFQSILFIKNKTSSCCYI